MRTAGAVLLAAGVLYCISCLIRDRPKGKEAFLIAVGRHMLPGLTSKLTERVGEEHVFAAASRSGCDMTRVQYVEMLEGLWLVTFLLAAAGALFIAGRDTSEDSYDTATTLERPSYGEESLEIVYEVEASNEQETASETITIEIPAQGPSEEEAEALMDQLEEDLVIYFETFQGAEDTSWPTAENEDIQLSFISLTPEYIDSFGQVQWDVIEEACTAEILITMEIGSYSREVSLSVDLEPVDQDVLQSLEDMLEAIDDGAYLTETMLVLPTTSDDGTTFTWSLAEENSSSSGLWMIILVLLIPFLIIMIIEEQSAKSVEIRRRKIYHTYPLMLNQFMIMMSAGLSLVRAWDRICDDYRKQRQTQKDRDPLYEEMLKAQHQMHNGASVTEAVRNFSERVRIKEVRQFASVILTNWKRGDSHVLLHLGELHDRAWEIRKNQIRKASEEADTKLLLPLMLMLLVVIVIVLTPAMMTMTV